MAKQKNNALKSLKKAVKNKFVYIIPVLTLIFFMFFGGANTIYHFIFLSFLAIFEMVLLIFVVFYVDYVFK